MPNRRTSGSADSGRNQCLESEDRKTVTADNAARSADDQRAADRDKNAERGTIAACDDSAGDETDQQTNDKPTSDDNNGHGLLQNGRISSRHDFLVRTAGLKCVNTS
jgi:hypothetical protein